MNFAPFAVIVAAAVALSGCAAGGGSTPGVSTPGAAAPVSLSAVLKGSVPAEAACTSLLGDATSVAAALGFGGDFTWQAGTYPQRLECGLLNASGKAPATFDFYSEAIHSPGEIVNPNGTAVHYQPNRIGWADPDSSEVQQLLKTVASAAAGRLNS